MHSSCRERGAPRKLTAEATQATHRNYGRYLTTNVGGYHDKNYCSKARTGIGESKPILDAFAKTLGFTPKYDGRLRPDSHRSQRFAPCAARQQADAVGCLQVTVSRFKVLRPSI
jgi:hypothetical protein